MTTSSATIAGRVRNRPKDVRDFDLPLGFHSLIQRRSSSGLEIWTTSWVTNCACLFFVLLIGGSATSVVLNWNQLVQGRWMVAVGMGLFGVIWSIALVGTIAGTLHRGKLVIDAKRRELRYYRGLGIFPKRVLSLDDIESLGYVEVTKGGTGADDTSWTYQILAAELRDGRTASLAVDSPKELLPQIEHARR